MRTRAATQPLSGSWQDEPLNGVSDGVLVDGRANKVKRIYIYIYIFLTAAVDQAKPSSQAKSSKDLDKPTSRETLRLQNDVELLSRVWTAEVKASSLGWHWP